MSLRLAIALGGAASILLAALGLYWKGRLEGAAQERPKVEAAQAQTEVARLETEAERQTSARVDVVMRTREAAIRTVTSIAPAALQMEDAHAALDPARAARLRRADGELCKLAPKLDGCQSAD